MRRAQAYVDEFKPTRFGVVTHKDLRQAVTTSLELPLDKVLYFGNMRGSNVLRDVDLLLVIGTPSMSDQTAYWMACVAFRGPEDPPSHRLRMIPRYYEEWQVGRGAIGPAPPQLALTTSVPTSSSSRWRNSGSMNRCSLSPARSNSRRSMNMPNSRSTSVRARRGAFSARMMPRAA